MALRWGCLGPGMIANDFFLAIRENLPAKEHEFAAVASKDLAKAQDFADKFKFSKAYNSYDELALDPNVDVVYISTLPPTHAELSIKMLDAGKHVLCETPMAMNLKQANRVIEKAKNRNRFFMEAIWSQFLPCYAKIREEIGAGILGDIKEVQSSMCFPAQGIERVTDPNLGGGSLLEFGAYQASLVNMVFNELPESIQAVGDVVNATGKGDVDTQACVVLKYKSGATARLICSLITDGDSTACISGTKGTIQIQSPAWAPECVITPTGTFETPFKKGMYNCPNSAGLHYEAAAVRDCILKGQLESEICSTSHSQMNKIILDECGRQIGLKYVDNE